MANNTLKYKRINPKLRTEKRIAWNKPIWWPIVIVLFVFGIILLPAFILYRRKENQLIS
jgi:hypothetical protein